MVNSIIIKCWTGPCIEMWRPLSPKWYCTERQTVKTDTGTENFDSRSHVLWKTRNSTSSLWRCTPKLLWSNDISYEVISWWPSSSTNQRLAFVVVRSAHYDWTVNDVISDIFKCRDGICYILYCRGTELLDLELMWVQCPRSKSTTPDFDDVQSDILVGGHNSLARSHPGMLTVGSE